MNKTTRDHQFDQLQRDVAALIKDESFFEAERLADQALHHARKAKQFDAAALCANILWPARQGRIQQALECDSVTVIEEPPEKPIDPGCYLVCPPLVAADARRLRLAAMSTEVPVVVLCREPQTQLRLWPIVAIGQTTVRTKVEPPVDPDTPDLDWFIETMEAIGDAAIHSLDTGLDIDRQVDAALARLDSIPDNEGLHHSLAEICEEAHQSVSENTASTTKR